MKNSSSEYSGSLGRDRRSPHVLVIDGNYVMQRSFHVFEKQDLRSPNGLQSGVIYGFIKSYQRLILQNRPDYVITVFDRGMSKYRRGIFPEYKANRKQSPDEVRWQFNVVRDYLRMSGWTPYVEDGVEGDDLAAKVSKDCARDNFIILYTVDHDWKQLLGKNVVMLRPSSQGEQLVTYDDVFKELGIAAERWPEIAAIIGDPGDGVIGLKGWGPAKSLKAINTYGDLWSAVNSDPVLIQHADQIEMNYDLTKLDGKVPSKVVPLEQNLVRAALGRTFTQNVEDFFDEWGMNEFLEQVRDGTFWEGWDGGPQDDWD